MKRSQNDKILAFLQRAHHMPLTQLWALKHFGCMRLAARIDDLKRRGVKIKTVQVYRNGKHFAGYVIDRGAKIAQGEK